MNQYLNESTKTLTDLLAEEFMERGREEERETNIKQGIKIGLRREDVMRMFHISEETYQAISSKMKEN